MPTDRRRIKKELMECAKDEETTGVSVRSVAEGDFTSLMGKIKGPTGTCYEGGVFGVEIKIPEGYPFEPPKMRFVTRLWHPNVSSQTGAICLDILKDAWSPALTIKTALLSLQALLSAPEPTDPQDAQVAEQYLNDRAEFESTAKFWVETHAQEHDSDEIVERLCGMGFEKDQVKAALAEVGGDENAAVEKLLG